MPQGMPLSSLPVVTPPVPRDLTQTGKPQIRFARRLGDFATAEMLPHRTCFVGTVQAGFVRGSSRAFQEIRGADHKGAFGLQ